MSAYDMARFRDRVIALLSAEKRTLAAITVYAAASGLVGLAVPLAAQSLVTSIAATGLAQPVIVLTLALFAALCIFGVLSTFEIALTEHVVVRFFVSSARRFARTPKLSSSDAAMFYDTVVVQKALGLLLVEAPALALQLMLSLLLLTVYHPLFLFFALGFVVTIGTFLWLFARRGELRATETSVEKHATAHSIIALAGEGERGEVEAATQAYVAARKLYFGVLLRQSIASYGIVAVASALFLAGGSILVMEGQLSLGQLVAADIVVALVTQNLMKLPKLLENYYDLGAALGKLEHASGPMTQEKPSQAPRPLLILARLTGGLLLLLALALIFVPWRQTAFSQGRVIAYAPADRQQAIEAPIEGRILRWYVQEGQVVKQGDAVVDISDNDPEILSRLNNERDAVERRLDATRRRTIAIEERITSLTRSRDNGIGAAGSRVSMAKQRIIAAERALDATKAAFVTTQLNIDRQRSLLKEGLASSRTAELATLEHQRADVEVERAVATVASAKDELAAIEGDKNRVDTDATAQLGDARASLGAAEAELASASAEMARMDVRLSRQSTQAVKAPRDGVVLRVVANAPGGTIVKSGDVLATLVPQTQDRAVELFLTGIDAPLVQVNQTVRLQFEGWPAVQFAGWPSIAVGTFGGRVAIVDPASDDKGQLRVLIVPENEPWPEPRFLRQGVRAQGWVLLARVRLGFEVWRRLNGFAPALPEKPKEEKNK